MSNNREKIIQSNAARTPQKRKENAQKAGRASGKARREKKLAAEQAALLLQSDCTQPKIAENLAKLGIPQTEQTMQMALIVSIYSEAMKGNISAAKYLFELTGQSPQQTAKVEVTRTIESDLTPKERAERFSDLLTTIGLEPADLQTEKPKTTKKTTKTAKSKAAK